MHTSSGLSRLYHGHLRIIKNIMVFNSYFGVIVPIQGLHPSKHAFEGRVHHNAAQRLSQFEGSFKCSLQLRPSFPSFWRMHRNYPSRPRMSQDPLRAAFQCREKWRHQAAMNLHLNVISIGFIFNDFYLLLLILLLITYILLLLLFLLYFQTVKLQTLVKRLD